MDKNKIIEAAAKLVAKGAYDKAIKEYQKILDADPKDVRILQKMGELYQKKNDTAQAAHFFMMVAENYSTDGFFLKAVALYKQVLKLNPSLVDVNLKLAELHQQLQLLGEAMAYYQLVANHYDKAGDTRASLGVLKKMVELDPENVGSRVKLAELYGRENMIAEAAQELTSAAEHLKRNNRVDDYLRVAERLSALDPSNLALCRELAESYFARGDHKRALAKLQICFKADPRDTTTLRLLANVFDGLGQLSKTVAVYKELAKVLTEAGQSDEARKVWRQVELLDPNDPDVQARGPARPESSRPPIDNPPTSPQPAAAAPVPAAPRPAPQPSPLPPPGSPGMGREQLRKLLTETDVYVKYGLHDKALEHLRKVFAVDPENLDAHEKAYQIYVASNNQVQAGEQLLNVLRLCTRRAEVQRGQPYLEVMLRTQPDHPEVPAFMSVLRVAEGEAEEEVEVEELGDDAILVEASDEDLIVPDSSGADDSAAEAPDVQPEEEPVDEPGSYYLDDGADEPLGAAEDDVTTGSGSALNPEADAIELVPPEDEAGVPIDDVPTNGESVPALSVEEGEASVDPSPEVEVVAEASDEEALASEEVAIESGFEPAGFEEQAYEVEAPPDEVAAEDVPAPSDYESSPVPPESAPEEPDPQPHQEECDEASFFLDQGLYDEARDIVETVLLAYPGHTRASEFLARIEAWAAQGGPGEEPTSGAFDLATELANELVDQGPPPIAPEDDFQYSVEEVFSEFKKGLEKVVKPEDVDTHYDLGIAYKEMGLIDDAVGEFEVARQGCIGKKKEVDCLTMVGILQMAKGNPAAAVVALQQALASEHATGETAKALRFELGGAHEAAGQLGRALYHFQAVEGEDPNYREVSHHVARLSTMTAPEVDELPAAHPALGDTSGPEASGAGRSGDLGMKNRKVGYV